MKFIQLIPISLTIRNTGERTANPNFALNNKQWYTCQDILTFTYQPL